MIPFGPCHYVWTGAGRVKAVKSILPIRLGDLTGDEPIPVLFPVEIVQSLLKIKCPPAVTPKTGDKARIPHKEVAVESSIAVIGYKTVGCTGLFQVAESQLPGAPVTINIGSMP